MNSDLNSPSTGSRACRTHSRRIGWSAILMSMACSRRSSSGSSRRISSTAKIFPIPISLSISPANRGWTRKRQRRFLAGNEDVAALQQEMEDIRKSGVDVVPRFTFGGKIEVVGLQTADVFADALFNAIPEG